MRRRNIIIWGAWPLFVMTFVVVTWLTYHGPTVRLRPWVLWISAFLFVFLSSWSVYVYWTAVHTAMRTVRGIGVILPILSLITLAFMSNSLATPQGTKLEALTTPGAVFVVSASILTVVGLALTISKLDDIHGRILDYGHLMERCEDLARQEWNRVENKHKPGKLIIFGNAPAFGNISAPKEFERYEQPLEHLLTSRSVEVKIVCHSWIADADGRSRHDMFYHERWPNHPELQTRIKQSTDIIKLVASNANFGASKELYRFHATIDESPFHLFMTSERAILFTALTYPEQREVVGTGGTYPLFSYIQSNNTHYLGRDKQVQIIGFETSDRGILRSLEKGVEARLKSIAVRDTQHLPNQNTRAAAAQA